MKVWCSLIFALLCATSLSGQKEIETLSRSTFIIGETLKIKSNLLHEARTLNIYLPNSYSEDTSKAYPVIYLLDGSRDEDFIHMSGLVQFGSFPWIQMIPESILVGIGNIDRQRDFTHPSTDQSLTTEFPTSGKSSQFISFVIEELQPYISTQYRAANTKTLIGQSLGGLLATEILFNYPESFDNYIIVSPSLWWDHESLLNSTQVKGSSNLSIYIAVGKEGEAMEAMAKRLYDKVSLHKKKKDKTYFRFFEELDHGDALHLAVYDAFEKLFRSKRD